MLKGLLHCVCGLKNEDPKAVTTFATPRFGRGSRMMRFGLMLRASATVRLLRDLP